MGSIWNKIKIIIFDNLQGGCGDFENTAAKNQDKNMDVKLVIGEYLDKNTNNLTIYAKDVEEYRRKKSSFGP